jgi:hypothetical protein
MIPLIELKYQSDIYENIEIFNKYCLNNDISLINELEVKNSYIWNISSYIYDFNNISNLFYKKDSSNIDDYKNLDPNTSIMSDNNMKIYNYYLNMSLGLFIFLIIFLISQIIIFLNIDKYNNLEFCLDDVNIDIESNFRYYIYILFIYILLFIIFFSLILKKIAELYTDTDAYEYIMLMKELDILLKENKLTSVPITDILKKYSKYKINEISYTTINNNAVINELLNIHNNNKYKIYANNDNYKITLNNIDKIEYYNSDEAKNKVKNKINVIFMFIYVYILLLIVPLYLLSISLQGNYIYLLIIIIMILIFSISVYNTYNTLHM